MQIEGGFGWRGCERREGLGTENLKFTVGKLRQVQDTTGCEHIFDGPTRIEGNYQCGWCSKCGNQVALQLDGAGNRTGVSLIVVVGP